MLGQSCKLRVTEALRNASAGAPLAALLLLCNAVACSKAESDNMAKASAKTPSASVAPPEEASPRQREARPTPTERLGVRPEANGIEVGEKAPDAHVRDADNKPIKLSTLWHQSEILLIFYRGGWCPYCNYQLRQLSDHFAEFQSRKVVPVALSVDRPSEAMKTRRSYEIPFPVLSDPDLVAIKAFKVGSPIEAGEYRRLVKDGVDLERRTGNHEHTVAIPSMFLIDQEGIVRWSHVDPDYAERPSIEQLTATLERILGETAKAKHGPAESPPKRVP
ncbi:MAG: peroxiredoxin family protein [Polyangiaceae bacterium]